MITSGPDVGAVVNALREKGVMLWFEGEKLRYRGPKGSLTRADLETLRAVRNQLEPLLGQSGGGLAVHSHERTGSLRQAPLSFSQLSHWQLYELANRPATRQISSATRLRGRLRIAALRRAIAEVVERHDALRTRIAVTEQGPLQVIENSVNWELEVSDLARQVPEDGAQEVQQHMREMLTQTIDVATAPLFEMRLLRLGDDEHALLVVMEHIIADAFSISVLVRDILAAYERVVLDRELPAPQRPLQFTDYAVWQRAKHAAWLDRHAPYWAERLKACKRLRFPRDYPQVHADGSGWATVPVRVDRVLRACLEEWCRLQGTTLVMGVFTAYVALVLRWCDVAEGVLQYQSDGRFAANVQESIGYFATVLYLRLHLSDETTFLDLMKQVTEEYCRAYEHADFCYMESQMPRPEFTRNTCFNWLPREQEIEPAGLKGSEDGIVGSAMAFEFPAEVVRRDNEPMIILSDAGEEIVGDVLFPVSVFARETMERFAASFAVFLKELLRDGGVRVKDVVLPRRVGDGAYPMMPMHREESR